MIKKYLVALGCILTLSINDNVIYAGQVSSKPYVSVHQVKSKSADTVDFSRFGQAVGDKRIVLLDELTHGEGNVFDLKRQVIEYLHQHKGFDVLILESGIYDVSRIWANDKAAIKSQASGNIFYMYANQKGVHKLFDYIDHHRNAKRPLYFAGFDGRLSGQLSVTEVVKNLQGFVEQHYPQLAGQFDWRFFNPQTQFILKRNADELNKLTDEQKYYYLTLANSLADLLGKHMVVGEGYNSSSFWAQVVKGNLMVGQQLLGFRRSDENDLMMAENVEWLMENVYPNKKVMIWGHFVHVNRQGLGPARYANLGSELVRRYPGQVYMAHFAGATGEFTDFITMKTRKVPTQNAASFETSILDSNTSIAFIDRQDVNFAHPMAQQATIWGYDYASTMPLMAWPSLWDGMFVLESVSTAD